MLTKEVEKRIAELERIKTYLEKEVARYPHGRLRIAQTNPPQYFLVNDVGDTKGRYIKKSEVSLAHELAQRDYFEKIYDEINKEIEKLQTFLNSYNERSIVNIYSKMSEERRRLITPIECSDEEYSARWLEENNSGNPFHTEELIYPTVRGEKVRSKSEKMIADMYYEMGIPYKYEAPLNLNSGAIKYPDFTILILCSRKVIYHEHMGLIEDDEYRQATLRKIREYEKNGIFTGHNLILTYETSYTPFDIEQLKKNIKRMISKGDM